MPLSHGCNHVTILTSDIERLIAFYTAHFDAKVTLDQSEGPLRHALIDLGGGFALHPFEMQDGTDHDAGTQDMFNRGHIDHLAINFSDPRKFEEVRRRLVEAGASAGRVRDFGAVRVMNFDDPDGMACECAIWADGPALTLSESTTEDYVHEPA